MKYPKTWAFFHQLKKRMWLMHQLIFLNIIGITQKVKMNKNYKMKVWQLMKNYLNNKIQI